jgi:oligoribonuclease
MARETRLVWMDLEMTGLDPERCTIVEIATLITEEDLSLVAEGPCLVIHQDDAALSVMDPVVVEMHTKSGLLDRIRASKVSLSEAERATTDFILTHCDAKTAPLCGNSIWKDRHFLERHMKSVAECVHYRLIDVSTIKELVRRWYPPEFRAPRKKESHRALDDIRESIDELKWYRARVMLPPPALP